MAIHKQGTQNERPRIGKVQIVVLAVVSVVLVFQLAISVRLFVASQDVSKGDMYVAAKRYKEGCDEYSRAVNVRPDDYNALYLYGGALLKMGQTAKAAEVLAQAVKLAPYHPLALDLLASAQMKLGKYDEALDTVKRAAKIVNNWPRAMRTQGRILTEKGQTKEARAKFEKALKAGYEPPDEMYRAIALTYVNEGKKDLAIESIGKAIDANPGEALNYLIQGQLLVQTGKLNPAGESLQRAVNLFGSNSTSVSKSQLPTNVEQAYLGLVVVYLRQDRLVGAANEIFHAMLAAGRLDDNTAKLIDEVAKRLDTGNTKMSAMDIARTRFLLARALFAAGDKDRQQRGLNELRNVTEMNGIEPRIRAAAYAQMANELQKQGMFARALAEIDKAKQIDPSLPQLDALRADILKSQKKMQAESKKK